MDKSLLKKIFTSHQLTSPTEFTKVAVGFTNDVYSVDETYILKVCKDASNEKEFNVEQTLYGFYKDRLPVPELIVYDDTKSLLPNNYMIYKKIVGENLYNVWHTYSNEQRKDIVKQLCGILRTINETNVKLIPKEAGLVPVEGWQSYVLTKLDKYLTIVHEAGTISDEVAGKIQTYIDKNKSCLDQQKIALVYWDAHFDNIIVKDHKIVGLLDFERTELASIDFALDIVKRMVDFPKKYMSEYAEQFAKAEDYAQLLDWYEEYYPELFDFNNLEKRISFYTIEHDLEDLENWPHVEQLHKNIEKIVG